MKIIKIIRKITNKFFFVNKKIFKIITNNKTYYKDIKILPKNFSKTHKNRKIYIDKNEQHCIKYNHK